MPKRKSAIRKKAKEKTTLQKQKQKQNVAQSVKVVVNLAARRRAATRKSPSGAPMGRAPPSQGSQPQVRTTSTQPIVSGNISDETRRAIMLEGVKQANQERAVLIEMERKANTIAEEQRRATELATVIPEKKTKAFKKGVVIPNPLKNLRAPRLNVDGTVWGSKKKAKEDKMYEEAAKAEPKNYISENPIQSPQQNIPRGDAFRYEGVSYPMPPRPVSVSTTQLSLLEGYTTPDRPMPVIKRQSGNTFFSRNFE